MRPHPDDAALMDAMAWSDGECAVHPQTGVQPVAELHAVLYCRNHMEARLMYARAEAATELVR